MVESSLLVQTQDLLDHTSIYLNAMQYRAKAPSAAFYWVSAKKIQENDPIDVNVNYRILSLCDEG